MGADSSCALKSRMAIGEVRHVLTRSEEHTSELQSRSDLVCRLLLEKKKNHSTPSKSPLGYPGWDMALLGRADIARVDPLNARHPQPRRHVPSRPHPGRCTCLASPPS